MFWGVLPLYAARVPDQPTIAAPGLLLDQAGADEIELLCLKCKFEIYIIYLISFAYNTVKFQKKHNPQHYIYLKV